MTKTANGDRKQLLGGTIGAAVLVNFILGLLTGSLSFVYFLLTLTYAGIAAVVMQVAIKNLKGGVSLELSLRTWLIRSQRSNRFFREKSTSTRMRSAAGSL